MTITTGNLLLDNDKIYKKVFDIYSKHDIKPANAYLPRPEDTEIKPVGSNIYWRAAHTLDHTYPYSKIDLQPHLWEEVKPLVMLIKSFYPNNPNYKIQTSWSMVLPLNGEVMEHDHRGSPNEAFVYYVNSVSGHPPFEYFTDKWNSINSSSGNWIKFDKRLLHRVAINTIEPPLIVLAFNI